MNDCETRLRLELPACPRIRFYMSRTKWLSRVYVYTIHATTHIPRCKLHEAEFLSFMDVSLFAFFRADISNALRYLHSCPVRITEIVQLLASGHKVNGGEAHTMCA